MLPVLVSKIGIPVLTQLLAEGLKEMNNPAAKKAGQALDAVQNALNKNKISQHDIDKAHRHIEAMRHFDTVEFQTLITEINQSLRAEIASQDMYVRRMRPTFGYIMAVTWAAQMLAVAYIIIDKPELSGDVIASMASLSTIWTVGLSVLGVYVYKRSEEKQILATPKAPDGPPFSLGALFKKKGT